MGFSFLCPSFLGKSFPFAFFGLPNQRRPGFCLRIEGELVGQLAVFRNKSKFKAKQLVVEFSIAQCGIGCAKNVYPMANITFGIVVETDENERFVFGVWRHRRRSETR